MKEFTLPDKRRGAIFRNEGIITLGCLMIIILFAVLGYVGFKVGHAYWTYYQVREQVREVLVWAVAGQPKYEAAIAQKVISSVSDVGVELKPRNIRISQTAEDLTIIVSWTEELEFPSFTYPMHFSLKLTEVKRWGKGGLVVK